MNTTHVEHWFRSSVPVRRLPDWDRFVDEARAAGVPDSAVLRYAEGDVPAFVWTDG
jgi:hypothetical protein